MKQIIYFFYCAFLLFPNSVNASNPDWESFTGERIIETSAFGYYNWILTNQNVIRYNLITQQKTIFDKNNTGIFFGCYGHIYADHSGRVWVTCCSYSNPITGQTTILAMYDGSTWTGFTAADLGAGFTGNILNFVEDSSGIIYFGFRKGFTSYSNGVFQSFAIPPFNLYIPNVNSIAIDTLGEVWLATAAGYFQFDGTQFIDYALPGKSPLSTGTSNLGGVECIAFERNGTIWLGSTDQGNACNGLYKYENGIFTKFDSTNSLLSSWKVNQIRIDKNNVKWILNNSKVYWHDNGSFTTFPSIDSLGTCMNITIDTNDIKWFHGYSTALMSFDNLHFKKTDIKSNTLNESYLRSIAVDTSGGIYCSSYQPENIPYYDGTNWSTITIPNHQSNHSIDKLVITDKNNVLWTVCRGKDVHRFDGITWTTFDSTNSPLGNCDFLSIYMDDLNRPWVNSYMDGMVYYYNGTTWITYDLHQIINDPDLYVETIGFSPGGIAWLSVPYHGLIRYDGTNSFQYLLQDLMYPNGNIRRISYSNTYGMMFLLNNGNYSGIKIFDGITVTPLTDLNLHLYSNFQQYHTAYSFVAIDSSIWLTGNDGAMRWEGNVFTIFDKFNSEFCGYGGAFVEKSENGKLYFGGEYLNICTPHQIINSLNETIEKSATQIFPNPANDYLSLQTSENIFQWKIRDVDGRIVDKSMSAFFCGQHQINLSTLKSGVYIFEIKLQDKTEFHKFVRE